jgi:hypothetical protein
VTRITGIPVVDTLVRPKFSDLRGVTSSVGDGRTIDVGNGVVVDVGMVGMIVLVTATTLPNSVISIDIQWRDIQWRCFHRR